MLKIVAGAVAGAVAWLVGVTILNLGLRYGWPAYAAVEKAMTFTAPMLGARLAISAASTLGGGYVAGRIAPASRAPLFAGVLLLLLFAPVHYMLWNRFPVSYHAAFLLSLPLLAAAGGSLARNRPVSA